MSMQRTYGPDHATARTRTEPPAVAWPVLEDQMSESDTVDRP